MCLRSLCISPLLCAAGSGTQLVKQLSKALAYALVFDAKGTLARRSFHLPERFKADTLGVQPPADAHGATREETVDSRLDTQKLFDHAAALCSSLDLTVYFIRVRRRPVEEVYGPCAGTARVVVGGR